MTRGNAAAWAVATGVVGALAVTGVGAATADVHAAASKATVSADPGGNIAFTKHKLTVKHGSVTIVMKNPSSSGLDHGIAVSGHGVRKVGKIVGPGKTTTVTVKLKAGKYTFYCPALGHRAAGMKGSLVVK